MCTTIEALRDGIKPLRQRMIDDTRPSCRSLDGRCARTRRSELGELLPTTIKPLAFRLDGR